LFSIFITIPLFPPRYPWLQECHTVTNLPSNILLAYYHFYALYLYNHYILSNAYPTPLLPAFHSSPTSFESNFIYLSWHLHFSFYILNVSISLYLATINTEILIIINSSKWKKIKHITVIVPHNVISIFMINFVIKSVYL